MDIYTAARILDGDQYGEEGSDKIFAAMKESGLVAVFGYSDDIMEFRGAVYDEVGAGTSYFTQDGLLKNDCEEEDCPYFKQIQRSAATVKAKFSSNGFTFQYETTIPHAKFVIKEDDESYCEGIVFALADVS